MKNNLLIILFITYLINIIIFNFFLLFTINAVYKCLMKEKVVPKLWPEVKVKVDIYYTTGFHC